MAVEEAQRCLHCKHMPCVSGCPVNVQIPKFIQLIAERQIRRRLRCHQGDQRAAGSLRPCMPAGELSVKPSACAASRASRLPSAVWSALWLTGIMKNGKNEVAKAGIQRPQGSRHRRWPCRSDLRWRPGQEGLRGHHLRGLPQSRAAYWFTAFRSSDFQRPSCRRK